MLPITSSLYLDREELKGLVAGFVDDEEGYLCRKIPAINAGMALSSTGESYGGFYWSLSADTFFAQAGKIGDIGWGQDYPRLDNGKLAHTPFYTKKYARSVVVPKEALNIPPVAQLNSIGQFLLQLREVVRGMAEHDICANLTNASIWTNNSTSAHSWSTTGNPVTDIMTGIDKVAEMADPDTIILGRAAYQALLANENWNKTRPLTEDRATSLDGTNPDQLAMLKDMIAKRFGLKNCFFATARWNSSATKATTTIANQFGDCCWIGRMGEFRDFDVIARDGGYQISPRAFIKSEANDIEFEEDEHLGKIELGAAYHMGFDKVDDRLGYLIQKCAATS